MYNSYDEYMREVLGYPYNRADTIAQDYYTDTYTNLYQNNNFSNTNELEECYPEIYSIVMPMVRNTCQMYANQTITKELVEEMTMKIYMSIETNENRSVENSKPLKNGDVINPNAKQENREDRQRPNNFMLRDLIKILLLNELLRPGNNIRPPRPPVGPMPPRPPRPPMGGMPRPPIRPY